MNLLDRLVNFWCLIGGILILSIMLITSLNTFVFAIDRVYHLFDGHISAFPGYEDYVGLMIGVAAFMFFPYCQKEHGHVVVDFFSNRFSTKFNIIIEKIWLFCLIFFILFFCYWLFFGMLDNLNNSLLSPTLGWKIWPFYIPSILSLVLWFFVSIVQLFQT